MRFTFWIALTIEHWFIPWHALLASARFRLLWRFFILLSNEIQLKKFLFLWWSNWRRTNHFCSNACKCVVGKVFAVHSVFLGHTNFYFFSNNSIFTWVECTEIKFKPISISKKTSKKNYEKKNFSRTYSRHFWKVHCARADARNKFQVEDETFAGK